MGEGLPTWDKLMVLAPYVTIILTIAAVGYAAAWFPLRGWVKSLKSRGRRSDD